MQTLLINAHPDFSNPDHFSAKLQQLFLDKFHANFPAAELTVLNLYENEIPRVENGQLLSIWAKQQSGEALTEQEAHLVQVSADLLAQFKAHHRIVIVSPLHNFNITSGLKNYLDNILIARETFRYTDKPDENGKISVGLMTNDYRVLLLFASGSIYTAHNYYEHLDFLPRYLKAMFSDVMGFDSFSLVRAEGTAVRTENEVLATVPVELDKGFRELYKMN